MVNTKAAIWCGIIVLSIIVKNGDAANPCICANNVNNAGGVNIVANGVVINGNGNNNFGFVFLNGFNNVVAGACNFTVYGGAIPSGAPCSSACSTGDNANVVLSGDTCATCCRCCCGGDNPSPSYYATPGACLRNGGD